MEKGKRKRRFNYDNCNGSCRSIRNSDVLHGQRNAVRKGVKPKKRNEKKVRGNSNAEY